MNKVIIIIRGLPGSGKSTVADILSTFQTDSYEHKYTVCTADDYFMIDGNYKWNPKYIGIAHKYCQDKCRKALESGEEKVFIANTNTTVKEMDAYYKMAKEFNYKVISMIVENRHNSKSIHNVPDKVINKMKNRFDIKL